MLVRSTKGRTAQHLTDFTSIINEFPADTVLFLVKKVSPSPSGYVTYTAVTSNGPLLQLGFKYEYFSAINPTAVTNFESGYTVLFDSGGSLVDGWTVGETDFPL